MSLGNFRKGQRGQQDRRKQERRKSMASFGSHEWLQVVQQDYNLWPKQERRKADRRQQERRQKSRVKSFIKAVNLSSLLSEEEKQMLADLARDVDTR